MCLHEIEGNTTTSPEDAIRQFNVKLLEQLPLDDALFFGMANQANLFPLNTGNVIKTKGTRAEKVEYFLQNVVAPRVEEYLPKLLKVMKESKVVNVERLADEIQAATGTSTYVYKINVIYLHCIFIF